MEKSKIEQLMQEGQALIEECESLKSRFGRQSDVWPDLSVKFQNWATRVNSILDKHLKYRLNDFSTTVKRAKHYLMEFERVWKPDDFIRQVRLIIGMLEVVHGEIESEPPDRYRSTSLKYWGEQSLKPLKAGIFNPRSWIGKIAIGVVIGVILLIIGIFLDRFLSD